MNESGHIVNFSGEKENIEGQTRFTKPPEKTITNKVPKKVKFSSRSFALVKKATLKIKESLAKKMEAQKVELAKQYQEAHETVKKAAQEESHKNKNEYNQIKLQVLTDELKSIGVKLILTDYVTTRLNVQGQSRAIKMPNFWQNIKRILSTVNMVNREFKDIGRSYGYGGIDRGNEGLDNMHKMIFGEKKPAKELAKEKVVQAPAQPKAPVQQKSGNNIDDYLKNFAPQQPSIEAANKEVDARLAEIEADINNRLLQIKSNLGENEHEQAVQPVEAPQIEKPVNPAFIPSGSISHEEPKRAQEAKTASNEPVVPSTTAPVNKSEEEDITRYLERWYGGNQNVVATPPVVPTQEADTKVTQPPIHYLNSTIGEVYTTEPEDSDDSKEETREEMIKRIYLEKAMREVDKRIAVEKEVEILRKQLEEAKKELERLRGSSQPNPNSEVVSPPKR